MILALITLALGAALAALAIVIVFGCAGEDAYHRGVTAHLKGDSNDPD